MIVRVPSESLQGVKKGDAVTVDLTLKDNGPAKSSKRQERAPLGCAHPGSPRAPQPTGRSRHSHGC